VDLSSNNPHPLNWSALWDYLYTRGGGGRPFVIRKITQGEWVDETAAADIAEAKAFVPPGGGPGFVVGGYLMDQGNDDPVAEEAVFRANSHGVPQFDDDELPEGLSAPAYIAHLESLVAQDPNAPQYLNQSEEGEGFPAGAGIWEANYNGQPGVTHRAGVLIHQFSSQGQIPGAAGEFDLDCWTGTEAQFEQFFGLVIPPVPLTEQENIIMGLPSNCSDAGAVRAQIREWWTTYRSDPMTGADQNLLQYCFAEPVANGGFGGNPDLMLANIIDGAQKAGTLRPQFAGAV
jgi:hypothetical protein